MSANRQALAALHQDEDFQSDLLRLPIQRVIDDTKKNPENYEKCVTWLRALQQCYSLHMRTMRILSCG